MRNSVPHDRHPERTDLLMRESHMHLECPGTGTPTAVTACNSTADNKDSDLTHQKENLTK